MNTSRRGGSLGGLLFGLLMAAVIGAGVWYFVLRPQELSSDTAVEAPGPASSGPLDETYIARKLRDWNLTPEDLKRELGSAGRIVREKGRALGDKVAAATSDVAIAAKIKAKYALDDRLQALKISIGCKDGHVTLSGTVEAQELIGRAIVLALDTEGVIDVVSSLKFETAPEPV